jgi:hypothetical protein
MGGARSAGLPPAAVAVELLSAIIAGRTGDMVALTAPDVTWRSAVRPGLTLYEGHEGIRRYAADLRAAWDPFRIEIDTVGNDEPGQATVRVRVIRRGEHGDLPPMLVRAVFTVREGLVTAMEATIGDES